MTTTKIAGRPSDLRLDGVGHVLGPNGPRGYRVVDHGYVAPSERPPEPVVPDDLDDDTAHAIAQIERSIAGGRAIAPEPVAELLRAYRAACE